VDWRTRLSGVPPDNVWCTRTVQGSTSHSRENAGALRYNSLDCPVCQRSNDYPASTVDCKSICHGEQCAAEVRVAKSEGTGLSGVAPDCLVSQEDKAPMVDRAPNPKDWVTWRGTGQCIVPVPWPITSSLPNGYLGGWGL
jgi:hypothetical protein